MRKAQEQARLLQTRLRLNNAAALSAASAALKGGGETTTSDTDGTVSDTEQATASSSSSSVAVMNVNETAILRKSMSSICLNGACTWKVESAYDNIYKEIHGHTESEAED